MTDRRTITCACGCGRMGPHAARRLVSVCYYRAADAHALASFPPVMPRTKTLPRGCHQRKNCNRIQVALRVDNLFIYLGLVHPADLAAAVAMYDAALAAHRQGADRAGVKAAAREHAPKKQPKKV